MNDKIKSFFALSFLLFLAVSNAKAVSALPLPLDTAGKSKSDLWAYQSLNIIKQKTEPPREIRVAVVDDGFRLSHKALKNYIYTNQNEVPGNYQDDDQNGYVDDIYGWDASDADNDVTIPKGREKEFYHGTYIAGIISTVFEQFYGSEANKYLKIIPVKVLSDNAKNTYLADGYKGIKYASEMGVDIICCAWSGGAASNEEKEIVRNAIAKGIIIVGSAGNFYSEKTETPSSLPGVISVAAVDSAFRKVKVSNYEMRVDMSAPGEKVYGAYPVADNAFSYFDGTSPAAAIIAGCMAALKSINPSAKSQELLDALKNSAEPLDSINIKYAGKLGAGFPDMTKAIQYIKDPDFKYKSFNQQRPEGKFFYKRKKTPLTFSITPYGAYKGIHLYASSADYKGNIKIYNRDSLCFTGKLSELYRGKYLTGSAFSIALEAKSKLSKEMAFSYYMETIDSTTLYCRETQIITQESGILTDNSGSDNYANNSDCKWQLKVPKGKKIRIEFDGLDTQANMDFVWIFDGTATIPDYLLAKFSGTNIPPVITTSSNEVLIWFVTDGDTTGKGWKLKYETVE